jgi:glycosyltransferase involved in cell wall biosynthesis
MINKKPQILTLVNSTHGGGAENTMYALHNYFNQNDWDSTLCALNKSGNLFVPNDKKTIQLNRQWSGGIISTVKNYLEFRAIYKTFSRAIILVNCELPELFMALKRQNFSHIIVIEHTSRPWNNRRFLGIVVRGILKIRGTRWVTVNSSQSSSWPFNEPVIHIPNPIIESVDQEKLTTSNEVVHVGRLRPEKNPEMVIRGALANDLTVSLFGDGNLRDELHQRYEVNKNVKFHGFLENPWGLISAHSLVVVASEYEGDGLVVLEAIKNGNPLVLRDNLDLRRFGLPDEHYFSSQEELSEKIGHYQIGTKDFRVTEAFGRRLLEPRSLEIVAQQWISFFESIVQESRG